MDTAPVDAGRKLKYIRRSEDVLDVQFTPFVYGGLL